MRALLWIIGIFALAAGVAMLAGANQGYVLLVLPPWRAQASLNLVVVTLIVAFFTTYVVFRLVARTLDLPGRVGAFRSRRQTEKASRSMKEALRALYEGRFTDAIRNAKVAHASGGRSPEAAIIAARAAHGLNDERRYREWLGRAGELDGGRTAQLMTEAELALSRGDDDDAGRSLDMLQKRTQGHLGSAGLRLSLELARRQHRWDAIIDLVGRLVAHKAMNADEARTLLREARLLRLHELANDTEGLVEFWRGLSREDLADREFVEQALPILHRSGKGAIARKTVDRLLEDQWSSSLARHYVLCASEGDEAKDALSRAERWLTSHPEDAGLLYSLGRQCMGAQIWGKAQSYLETSAKLSPSADVHFALAELMEALERPVEAKLHYRKAADLAMDRGG